VKNLKRGLTHRFKVRAFNKTNEYGGFSETVSISLDKGPTVLLILDGFGLSEQSEHNAIAGADTPVLDRLMKECPFVKGKASGLAVGLPEGQMGSSEVGHLNIGAGRVVDQDIVRISKEIDNGEFYKNEAFLKAINNVKEKGSSLHLYGLLSDGGVHSHNSHLYALLELAKRSGLEKVYVHCFLDGRDTPPKSGEDYVQALQDEMDRIGCGKIATVGGRYYAMDRDTNWDRIEMAYRAMTLGEGESANSAIEAVTQSYAKDVTDEFVLPTVVKQNDAPVATIDDGDSIIFFNFRSDRAREITSAFCSDEFDGFERGPRKQVSYVCFTDYDSTIPNKEVAFKKTAITNTFGEWIAAKGMKQARIAETEKYAHVTHFFNGGVEEPFKGEDRFMIPSPKVATYDLQPEMSVNTVCDTMIEKIRSGNYQVVIANFANSDMVGHTGVEEATIKAVESIDKCIGRLVKTVEETDGQLFICADHGNAEKMVDDETGDPWTAHTSNPVPFILVNYDPAYTLREGGCLADIAPTLIEMMGMEKPAEMTGQSLLIKK
jgi:2,3-bisphosphoglycerate-independent phosphoglycerate mutase